MVVRPRVNVATVTSSKWMTYVRLENRANIFGFSLKAEFGVDAFCVVIGATSSYCGKSWISFFPPLITSTVGRETGGGCVAFGADAVSLTTGRGAIRRGALGAALGAELEPTPGSGTSMARSPLSRLLLFAPEVCSSAWSTELRITS